MVALLRRVLNVADDVQPSRAMRAVRTLIHRTICAVAGHDYRVHAADYRICLRCANCERETEGWRIAVAVPLRTAITRTVTHSSRR